MPFFFLGIVVVYHTFMHIQFIIRLKNIPTCRILQGKVMGSCLSLIFPLLFTVCLLINPSSAQPDIIRFERFSDEEGLPNNMFVKIIQDRYGILWMAGLDGLASYDGYSVRSFRHSFTDTSSLSGNNVSTVFEDSKGRLWVGIVGAPLCVSDRSKSSFKRLKIPLEEKDRLTIRISDITEDSMQRIWIATGAGLFIVSESAEGFLIESFESISHLGTISSGLDLTNTLYTDKKGKIWLGSKSGLFVIDPASKRMLTPSDISGLPAAEVYDIEVDREDRIWIACANGSARLFWSSPSDIDFHSMTSIPFSQRPGKTQMAFDLDNRLWAVVFGHEAYGFDLRDSMLFFQSTVNSNISHERFFRKPFVDHSGNTWLPVEGFYVYPYPKGFNTYNHPFAFHQSNSCIYGADGHLWFGYREKGIVQFRGLSVPPLHFSAHSAEEHTIPVDHVQDILKVRSGNLIIVGFNNVSVMSPDGLMIASHQVNGTNRAVFEDTKGRIWIGGYGGLHLFSETKGVLKTYIPAGAHEESGHFIQTIQEDADGRIWFASDVRGLGMLDPETGMMQQFLPAEGDPHSLPSYSVLDIAIDQHNILWLGTDVALVKFDPVSHRMNSYDRSDGIENDYIASVVCTADGMVWVSTHSGISSFDPVKKVFVNYGQKDGLSNYSYYNRGSFYSSDGVLYFGGKNGVDYFRPDQLRANPTSPKMFLSALTIHGGQQICGYNLGDQSDLLKLSYKDRLMQIEITGVHFANQEAVRYVYRMDGMHDDWVDLGHQRTVFFSDLAPGPYLFRAKAISGDNIWSASELKIPIHVTPPFYATVWFRLLALTLFLGLLISFIRYRENQIKQKDKLEAEVNRKIVELERRALQAQMNPHFIYNSMNSIQQFMILHDMEGAMKYLTKFSRILRTVLNISAQNRIPLSDEIMLIKDYLELENMRFPDRFTYDIHVSPEINTHTVEIPPFFIQPQVENAIRHGLLKKTSPGHLRIEITADETHLYVIVQDNGIGREAAKQAKHSAPIVNTSKGLSIVEERLSHMHSANGFKPFKIIDLYDAAQRPAGTRVEIILPLD